MSPQVRWHVVCEYVYIHIQLMWYTYSMGKPTIDKSLVSKLRELRRSGHSVKEIVNQLKLGTGTVSKYCKDVHLDLNARTILDSKKYPAKIFF